MKLNPTLMRSQLLGTRERLTGMLLVALQADGDHAALETLRVELARSVDAIDSAIGAVHRLKQGA